MSESGTTRPAPEIILVRVPPMWVWGAQDVGGIMAVARAGFAIGLGVAAGLLCHLLHLWLPILSRMPTLWAKGWKLPLLFLASAFLYGGGALLAIVLGRRFYKSRVRLKDRWERLLNRLLNAGAKQIRNSQGEVWCEADDMHLARLSVPLVLRDSVVYEKQAADSDIEIWCATGCGSSEGKSSVAGSVLPAARARIICMGEFTRATAEEARQPPAQRRKSRWRPRWKTQEPVIIPDVGELHFPPEIIIATGWHWKTRVRCLIIGMVLAALFLAHHFGYLSGSFNLDAMLWPLLVMGTLPFLLAMWAQWFWKGILRPTYMRLAPGIIQSLEYRWFWHTRPLIRSYPIAAGTLAVITHSEGFTFLTLVRGDQRDSVFLSELRNSFGATTRVWQAMSSTAPTPPLDQEALVG